MKKIAQFIYTIYVVIVFLVTFLIQFPFFLIFLSFGKKGAKAIYTLFRIWSHVFLFLSVITLRVYGKEKIERKKNYVVIANHNSFLDTPMIFASLPIFCKTLARSDFSNIPIFGLLYKTMTIPVNRASTTSKKKSVQLMLESIKKDKATIFIFPEGSFNESDEILKPFYNGAFQLAKDSSTEILPILFPDTIKRWHFSSFFAWTPGVCRAYILDPIDLDIILSKNTTELNDYVRDLMASHLRILRG